MAGVTRWTIDRGRSYELDKTQTGVAQIALIDTDGTYDPTNTGGPHFGDLNPMTPAAISLENPVTSTFSTLFQGFTADWTFDLDVSEKFTTVTLDLVDGFDLLAAIEMTPGDFGDLPADGIDGDIYFDGKGGEYAGSTDHIGPDDRINQALDDAGWPTSLRNIFSGNVALQDTKYARRDGLLSVLFDTADAEFPGVSNVYMSKDGKVRFRGRFARFNPTNPQYGITFWDAGDVTAGAGNPNVALISSLQFNRGQANLINSAIALPQAIDETLVPGSLVTDGASITSYGRRSVSFNDLLLYRGEEAGGRLTGIQESKQYAQYYVDNYAQPRTRVPQITVRTQDPASFNGPATWALICGVEIGDVIHLNTTHPGGGGFDEDFYVEGIHYDAVPMNDRFPEITLTLDLSPRAYYGAGLFSDIAAPMVSTRVSQAPQLSTPGARR